MRSLRAILALRAVSVQPEVVWLDVQSQVLSCPCPQCGRRSDRCHSHYTRVLKDLPLLVRRFRLRLTAHKFVCTTRGCPQPTFCERLPTVAGPWQRQATCRVDQDTLVALKVGGESYGIAFITFHPERHWGELHSRNSSSKSARSARP